MDKPLDKWYFSLTDGRRIGKGFLLVQRNGEKVTLSKRAGKPDCTGREEYLIVRQITWIMSTDRYLDLKLWMNIRKW
ncbi:MAG: hypothetical protein ACLTDT_08535 [Clostridium sp.]